MSDPMQADIQARFHMACANFGRITGSIATYDNPTERAVAMPLDSDSRHGHHAFLFFGGGGEVEYYLWLEQHRQKGMLPAVLAVVPVTTARALLPELVPDGSRRLEEIMDRHPERVPLVLVGKYGNSYIAIHREEEKQAELLQQLEEMAGEPKKSTKFREIIFHWFGDYSSFFGLPRRFFSFGSSGGFAGRPLPGLSVLAGGWVKAVHRIPATRFT